MLRLFPLFLFSFLFSLNASAAWFPVPGQHKVDFTADELSQLQSEFHQHFDQDFQPLGGKFELTFFKSIPSFLSFATIKDGVHQVAIMGGNLSKKTMTMDSLRLLICHEVGHFLGGGPRRITLDPEEDQEWNVIEGAADYYASLQCMKRLLRGQDHTAALVGKTLPPVAVERCQAAFADDGEGQAVCQRSLLASQQLILFFASVKKVENIFSLEFTDPSIVEITSATHPELQCRLDTYAAGAYCNADPSVILDRDDLVTGTCDNRPLCWFKPSL